MAVPQFGNEVYTDRSPVPIASYRCKSSARQGDKIGHTHLCKIGIDHDGPHKCICGRSWSKASDL